MKTMAIAFPILSGMADEARRFAAEVRGPRMAEHRETSALEGLTREEWYLQSTPQGDIVITVFDSDDPARALGHWTRADSPYDLWFVEQVKRICGVDLTQPVPALPEQILAWRQS